MWKIKIHPFFILLVFQLLLSGKSLSLGCAAVALSIHEAGHIISARKRGYELKDLTLMPFGAVMYAEDGLPDRDSRWIAFCGPAINIFFAFFLCAVWWFVPVLYPATKQLFIANISIGLFNLLPCYPLDGSRILLASAKNKQKTLLWMRLIGLFFGTLFAVLFFVGLFYSPSLQPAFLSVMFFIGSLSDAKKEAFKIKVVQNYLIKDPDIPLEEKTIYVSSAMKVGKVRTNLDSHYIYKIIVSKSGKNIACLKGQAIEELFFVDQDMTLGEYLSQKSLVGV